MLLPIANNKNVTVDDRSGQFAFVDWVTAGAATIISFVLYMLGLASSIDVDFSGIFVTGANYAAIPHPSGYPVWTLYAWLFTRLLPFSNIAWRVAVSSAVAAAISSGLIALMISYGGAKLFGDSLKHLPPKHAAWARFICGVVGALAFAFNQAFWSTALTGGAWPLTILLFTLSLLFLMRWIFTGRRKFLFAAGFAYGLSITNSLALLSVAPGLLVLGLLGLRNIRKSWWVPVIAAGIFVVGLCGFLYLPVASMTNPPMNWGYARTAEGFLHTVKRGQYESIRPTDNLGMYARQINMYAAVTTKALGWYYLPTLLAFGYGITRLSGGGRWLAGLAVTYLCSTLLLLWVLNPTTDRTGEELNKIFFSISYVILALVVGWGLLFFTSLVSRPIEYPKPEATI